MKINWLHISNLRGGRCGLDPFDLLPGQCAEAYNVDGYDGMWGRKRRGADSIGVTGGTAFTGPINALARWVPGTNDTAAEMWAVDAAATPLVKRLAAGTAWANVSLIEAITSRPQDVNFAALNGKLFFAYKSASARLHCYDPGLSVPQVRRVGTVIGSAPNVTDTGSGSYAATARTYRFRELIKSGSVIVARSEPTVGQAFTPSGSGTAARVTHTNNSPDTSVITHWELEVSLDGVTFYLLTTQTTATGTYDDSAATSTYSSGTLSDPSGYYQTPHSAKFLVSDGNRLIWAGDWDAVQPSSRVWFSPVLGSADKGDDERWVLTSFQKNYIDLGTKDGGAITALGQPLNGVIFVFKYRAIWALYPTGDVNGPYIFRKLRDDIGCVDQKSVQICRDVTGRNALHFWDALTGPWRVSAQGGFEYLGRDIEDISPTVNLAAANRIVHSVWHSAIHQWWVFLAVGAGDDPSIKLVFDPLLAQRDKEGLLRGGWYKHDGDSAAARCSCMFANTLGAAMSSDLKPHVGLTNVTPKVYKCDSNTATDDAGTAFQAYIDSGPTFPPLQDGRMIGTGEAMLTAKAAAGVTIQATIEADFGAISKVPIASLTAAGAETRVFRKFEDSALSEITSLQVRLGDAAAVSNAWVIDRFSVPIQEQGLK